MKSNGINWIVKENKTKTLQLDCSINYREAYKIDAPNKMIIMTHTAI